jgi:type III pantothenate kinase
MKLLIDIGNTRIKWAQLHGEMLVPMQAITLTEWHKPNSLRRVILGQGTPEQILVSNVAGHDATKALQEFTQSLSIESQLIEPTRVAFGVTNGYTNPKQLGVDRWLSLIAAWNMQPDLLCIVSIGTALTIDAITESGQHLGGQIMPGPELMRQSLMQQTSDIAIRSYKNGESDQFFANNTQCAVTQGLKNYVVSSVMASMERIKTDAGKAPTLLITGGGSPWLTDALTIKHQVIPDLVLRGLALIATRNSNHHNTSHVSR